MKMEKKDVNVLGEPARMDGEKDVLHENKMTPDELLAVCAQQGSKTAESTLVNRYMQLVRARAKTYFLIGADREDLIQEGMIGLFKAIRDYRAERQTSFKAFAELCITRQIITAIKTATRQKHMPLNTYVSLNRPVYDEESERMLVDILYAEQASSPEDICINQEELCRMENKMEEMLSGLERKVLGFYLEGKSYQEISDILQRPVKSIDNALQRVKRKMEKYLQERG